MGGVEHSLGCVGVDLLELSMANECILQRKEHLIPIHYLLGCKCAGIDSSKSWVWEWDYKSVRYEGMDDNVLDAFDNLVKKQTYYVPDTAIIRHFSNGRNDCIRTKRRWHVSAILHTHRIRSNHVDPRNVIDMLNIPSHGLIHQMRQNPEGERH